MKTVYAIQTLAFEDLGSFSDVFLALGYQLLYLQLGVDDLAPALTSPQPVVLLGGPISVYDTALYPYLTDYIAALKRRLSQNLPTLGICLGAQLIASALGAKVYAGQTKEIGWSQLSLSTDAKDSALKHLEEIEVLHWHGDTFELPADATLLASSELYPNQAFQVGNNILALQFHVEVAAATIEPWLIGHSSELQQAAIDVLALRADHQRYAQELAYQADLLLRDWLAGIQRPQQKDGAVQA
jgi:GMP synthase (glutamine-hydrolysing)